MIEAIYHYKVLYLKNNKRKIVIVITFYFLLMYNKDWIIIYNTLTL